MYNEGCQGSGGGSLGGRIYRRIRTFQLDRIFYLGQEIPVTRGGDRSSNRDRKLG